MKKNFDATAGSERLFSLEFSRDGVLIDRESSPASSKGATFIEARHQDPLFVNKELGDFWSNVT